MIGSVRTLMGTDAGQGILAPVVRLGTCLHVTLVLLTATSAVRYVQGHGLGDRASWVLGGAGLLLAV